MLALDRRDFVWLKQADVALLLESKLSLQKQQTPATTNY